MSIYIGGSSCPDICQAEITYFLEHWTNSCSVTRSVARGRHSTSSKVARDSHIKRRPLDFTVVSTPTLVPLVCSDLKVWDRGHSEIETTVWGKLQHLILGIPGTLDALYLYCYVPVEDVMWLIEFTSVSIYPFNARCFVP